MGLDSTHNRCGRYLEHTPNAKKPAHSSNRVSTQSVLEKGLKSKRETGGSPSETSDGNWTFLETRNSLKSAKMSVSESISCHSGHGQLWLNLKLNLGDWRVQDRASEQRNWKGRRMLRLYEVVDPNLQGRTRGMIFHNCLDYNT